LENKKETLRKTEYGLKISHSKLKCFWSSKCIYRIE